MIRKSTKKKKTTPKTTPRKKTPAKRHKKDPDAALEAERYENPIASRKLILSEITREGALGFQSLAEHLNIQSDDQLDALRRRLRAMVRDGQLVQNRRGGYLPVDESHLVRGRVIAHPDGYGFLVPEAGGDDLFLNARQMRTLLHGDKAVVRVSGVDRRGRLEGAVISVFERANQFIVGRLFIESGVAVVVADNKRITQDILIPENAIDGAVSGQIVKVEIVEQPTFKRQPIGRVVDVLGDHMSPGMEVDIAIHNYGLPHEFPQQVLDDAEKWGGSVRKRDKEGRVDLRSLPLVTIDGEDARDFDDAVYCEPVKGIARSGWRLIVAIAEVAHYVNINSALDKEAYDRATSVYFPGRVIPMLPENLSNGLCSLNPQVDRLCLVCEMRISAEGSINGYKFHEAVIKSHARLTYTKVADAVVERKPKVLKELDHLLPHLENLYAMYRKMDKARQKRGAIEFDTIETKFEFTDDMRIKDIHPTVRNDAHKIIEECMIAANISAARFISKHKLPALYRIHELPDDDKLEELRGFLDDLGLKLGAPSRKISPRDYAKLSSAIKKREDTHLIQTLMLRSMQQALYRPENIGHFGLALKHYAHFTSPIRRYPDLLVHRAIKHILHKRKKREFPYDQNTMTTFGEHCSANERRADEATRDAEFAMKCEYMLDKVGMEFSARVTGVVSFGLFVELDDYYVEGLIHITSLPKDYYDFDPISHQLVGENRGMVFRLSDKVNVRLANVDMDERRIDFELIK
ncbi:MAG: ribonuclease R [Gammaproteobacteria bacterium]|nr:ribonuclease R [Gammaproteobacteria bacterium]